MADQTTPKATAPPTAAKVEAKKVELTDGKAAIGVDGFTIELELVEKATIKGGNPAHQLQVSLTHPNSKNPAVCLLTVNTGATK